MHVSESVTIFVIGLVKSDTVAGVGVGRVTMMDTENAKCGRTKEVEAVHCVRMRRYENTDRCTE